MRKFKSILVLFVLVFVFSSCNNKDTVTEQNNNSINILCCSFCEYDWTRNIVKNIENVNVSYLLDNGADMHSFSASAKDISEIRNSDLFIYCGGISDKSLDDVISSSDKEIKYVDLMNCINEAGKLKKIDEDEEGEEDEYEHKHHNEEYDEHIALSIENAKILTEKISDKIKEIIPEENELIEENTKSYITELDNLDNEYKNAVENAENKTIVIADRFPFVYLASDYSIECVSAFQGCSSETDASFNKIIELAKKVDEIGAEYIFVIEGSDEKTAKAVIENSISKSSEILKLNSMQSVIGEESDASYTQIMEENLNNIKKAIK